MSHSDFKTDDVESSTSTLTDSQITDIIRFNYFEVRRYAPITTLVHLAIDPWLDRAHHSNQMMKMMRL